MAVATQTMATAVAAERVHETAARVTERPAALPALTGLRFFAALWVVLCHLLAWQPALLPSGGAWAVLRTLVQHGYAAVSLFFILSGFILAYSYVQQGGTLRGSMRAFYVARIARIYPVYLLGFVLAALPFTWSSPPSSSAGHSWLVALATATLTQAWMPQIATAWNTPGWSLSVEAAFYVLFPLLVLALRAYTPRRLLWLMAACCAAALCVPLVSLAAGAPAGWLDAVLYSPLARLPEFALGVALGRLYRLWGPSARVTRATPLVLLGAAVLLALPGVPLVVAHNGLADPLFALALYGLAGWHRPVSALLLTLGEASYALYLLHFPLYLWLAHSVGDVPAIPYALLAIALSLLAYRLVEQPGRRLLCAWLTPQGHAARLAALRAPSYSLNSSSDV